MPSVLFWKCCCGTKWRPLVVEPDKIAMFACRCTRRNAIRGPLAESYYLPSGACFAHSKEADSTKSLISNQDTTQQGRCSRIETRKGCEMKLQGQSFAIGSGTTERIVQLLRTTDLTINEIAERFGCSRSAVGGINRRHKIRDYSGLRSHWIVAPTPAARNSEAGRTCR